jgi:hypothetical protein
VLLLGVLCVALLQAPWRELRSWPGALSYFRTDRKLHAANRFTFRPIFGWRRLRRHL